MCEFPLSRLTQRIVAPGGGKIPTGSNQTTGPSLLPRISIRTGTASEAAAARKGRPTSAAWPLRGAPRLAAAGFSDPFVDFMDVLSAITVTPLIDGQIHRRTCPR